MDWTQMAAQFGLPVALLAALVWGLWQAAVWSAENVVRPIVAAHQQYLKATQAQGTRIATDLAEAQEHASEQAQTISDSLEVIKQTNVQSAASLAQIAATLPTVCRFTPEKK
jgi:hypothetical protein